MKICLEGTPEELAAWVRATAGQPQLQLQLQPLQPPPMQQLPLPLWEEVRLVPPWTTIISTERAG